MRAIRIDAYGGPEALRLVELPTPKPGPGQVLVTVEAAGVNFIDTYQRTGFYPIQLPAVLGQEAAGQSRRSSGADVQGWEVLEIASPSRTSWRRVRRPCRRRGPTTPGAPLVPDSVSSRLAAAAMLRG